MKRIEDQPGWSEAVKAAFEQYWENGDDMSGEVIKRAILAWEAHARTRESETK